MSQDMKSEPDLVTAVTAQQIGRCGATTGPSAEDWESKRPVITDLYKKMKLSELDVFMRSEHGFYASKRMYNQRFKQWGISKYIKFSEKEGLLADCGNSVKELTARYRAGKIKKGQYEKTLRWIRTKQSAEPSHLIELKAGSTEVILRSLRDYHYSLADSDSNMVAYGGERFLNLEASKESNDLWFGILRGVKNLGTVNSKVLSDQAEATFALTFAMLRQVGYLTAPAMLERPLDFVYEVLIEMTALQGKNWSELRHAILQLFDREATRIFGSSHPMAVICREMLRDTDTSDVTFRSLDCIRDLVAQLWGEDHNMAFKAQMATQKALLKVRNLAPAIQMGMKLLQSSRQKWGEHSQQARMAGHRLGQLYTVMNEMAMARGKPDWNAFNSALRCYNDVIRVVPSGQDPRRTGFLEDETTLSTMGDIAYINNRTGNDAEALAWYQKAAELSRRICNPGSTIMRACISMLINKQKEMKRFDQAAAWDAILSSMEARSGTRI